MYMRRGILLLLFCFMALARLFADTEVKGWVVDGADNATLTGVTVRLLDTDSTFIQGTTTDANGRFLLRIANEKTYLLSLSYIGYDAVSVQLQAAGKPIDLGKLQLYTSAHSLQGVTVTADATIRKVDRQIILPTSRQIAASSNGLNLLENLQLHRILVNPVMKTVTTASGEAVQLRINGAAATLTEVTALQPKDILRVEYHDQPGLRYGGAAAVIDYIVKHRTAGGALSLSVGNGINWLGFGNYSLSGKVYMGRSSLALMADWSRRDTKWLRENTETFNFSSGTIRNKELGEPTKVRYDYLYLNLIYTLTNTDKNMLSVAWRNDVSSEPNSFDDRESRIEQGADVYHVSDRQRSKSFSPSLDVYFQQKLPHHQTLYFDVVGTIINSSLNRRYSFTPLVGTAPASDIRSSVDGRKYSLISEAIYEKAFGKAFLSAGIKHTQQFMRNTYDGSIYNKVSMTFASTYLYTEFRQEIGKFNYDLGVGMTRTATGQGGNHLVKTIFSPTLTLTYRPGSHLMFRYHGFISGIAPSLSDLSDVAQGIDKYQMRKGNPNLHTYTCYTNDATISWQSKKFTAELFARYRYYHRPIMAESYEDGGMIVRTSAHQRNFHLLNIRPSFTLKPFGDLLTVSLSPYFNRYISNGNSYTHTYSNWGMNAQMLLLWKKWSLSGNIKTMYRNLWGETLTDGESAHFISLGYTAKPWSVNLMAISPFSSRYKRRNENFSALAPSTQYYNSSDFPRSIVLTVSLNMNFGKQHREGRKRISNSDNDSGIMKSN